ncbi:class A beta-lactamase [Agreia sp. COWG]|uniref:class A beta-lactamase n=1 Tax=Agreia sp. COWG TaxID=2773266 RepID=UPI001AF18496|nr:beta-lactamase precursor (putative hydrolase) [Agreia sp. COWG]
MNSSARRSIRFAVVGLVLLAGLAGCVGAGSPGPAGTATAAGTATVGSPVASPPLDAAPQFAQLEQEFDARLGVYALDVISRSELAYRADERFAYASTFKAIAAGILLRTVSDDELDKTVFYGADEVLPNSPVTELSVDSGITLRAAAEAAVRFSDNTAANLVFERLGGPEGFAAALRELGDTTTSSDRVETELNSAIPGDVRDTTTPRAFGIDLGALLTTDTLGAPQQAQLVDWMTGNATGEQLIRAGVPADWAVADKSGAGGYGSRNDIAVLWPPTGSPLILVIMSTRTTEDADYDNALVARAATVVVQALGR